MFDYRYRLDFQVRDYECDLQGIVNNAVYQNYLEHTRHEFLKSIGIDFNDLTRRRIFLFAFLQDVYKYPSHRSVLSAKVIGTAVKERGRPFLA